MRYYRENAQLGVAGRLVDALERDVGHLQSHPGIGSPALGTKIGIEGLRAWAVSGFPLVILYFEWDDHLDVVRLLGQRQDIATILEDQA